MSEFAICGAVVLVGIVAGALSGTLGVGSGIFLVPAMVLLLHCSQKSAQGMALAVMVPMALLGAFRYARAPGVQLQWTFVALLIAGALAGVLAGTKLMARVPDAMLQRAFAVFLLIVAARMLWSTRSGHVSASAGKPVEGISTPGRNALNE